MEESISGQDYEKESIGLKRRNAIDLIGCEILF